MESLRNTVFHHHLMESLRSMLYHLHHLMEYLLSPPFHLHHLVQVSSRQTGRSTSNEEPHWFVDVIDKRQVIKTIRLKVKDVHNLDKGLRIIVEFDEYHAAIGKSAGLIAGVLGQLATNPMYFPIGFEKWQSMPKSFLDRVFNDIIVWREYRLKLWKEADDPLLSKEDIIKNVPDGIPMDQWALFVTYRMKEETKERCKKNAHIRKNQLPHTCGAMSLARRRAAMKAMGKAFDRGKMWTETHKRKDGSYVTDEARVIGEGIEEIRTERAESLDEPSPNDALGIVFGPEHPGRVRGLGLGVVPTVPFKQTSARYRRGYVGSSSTTAPTPAWQQEMTDVKSKLNALISLYERNIGNIPEEFAHLFSTPQQAPDLGSDAPSTVEPRRSLDESNNDDRPSVN
uniref:Uncharacterized protein LOC104210226 isoform X1 n=1 Tax=Nicotiana sylvestris TaxID=4096 RepID=A0A1U7V556_NICSY|nr:PREDICTED: uncharacterized protein LOC104210226 isoform X1 [Nicotiana sylvestris]XP_009757370.1 PREDICTED: uncharacterized protein LOC104210226 isoform X1 [Nicotiana sylvestris]